MESCPSVGNIHLLRVDVSTFQASLAGCLLAAPALIAANNLIGSLALEVLFLLELTMMMMMMVTMRIMDTRFHIVIGWSLILLRSVKREFGTWPSQGPRWPFTLSFDPRTRWPTQAHAATSRARILSDRIGVDPRGSHVTWRWRNTRSRHELEIGEIVRDDISKRGRGRRVGKVEGRSPDLGG